MIQPATDLYDAYRCVLLRRKHEKKKRPIKYHGITQAARELGVNRSHIYRVLEGERRSPRIEAYFKRQKKSEGAE